MQDNIFEPIIEDAEEVPEEDDELLQDLADTLLAAEQQLEQTEQEDYPGVYMHNSRRGQGRFNNWRANTNRGGRRNKWHYEEFDEDEDDGSRQPFSSRHFQNQDPPRMSYQPPHQRQPKFDSFTEEFQNFNMYQHEEIPEQVCQQSPVFNLVTIEQKERKFYKSEPKTDPIVQALNTFQPQSIPRTIIPSKYSNVVIRDLDEGPSYSGLNT